MAALPQVRALHRGRCVPGRRRPRPRCARVGVSHCVSLGGPGPFRRAAFSSGRLNDARCGTAARTSARTRPAAGRGRPDPGCPILLPATDHLLSGADARAWYVFSVASLTAGFLPAPLCVRRGVTTVNRPSRAERSHGGRSTVFHSLARVCDTPTKPTSRAERSRHSRTVFSHYRRHRAHARGTLTGDARAWRLFHFVLLGSAAPSDRPSAGWRRDCQPPATVPGRHART